METITEKLYEGMFLVDSADAASDWDGVLGAIKEVLERSEAEVVSMRKWDDRRLAYDIGGKNRGVYILCYFKVVGEKIAAIERDVQLSERIMRVLILGTEPMSEADLSKATPLERLERERAEAAARVEAASKAEAAAKTEEAVSSEDALEADFEAAAEGEPAEQEQESAQGDGSDEDKGGAGGSA